MSAWNCGGRTRRRKKVDLVEEEHVGDLDEMGYLAGLSAPSVVQNMPTLAFWPRSKPTGQTRLPTFSMMEQVKLPHVDLFHGLADLVGLQVAALAGVDLDDFGQTAPMRWASRAVDRSPTMTPMRKSARRAATVFSTSVVLPQPGRR